MHTDVYSWEESVADSTNFDYPAVLQTLLHDKNKIILDIGCGNGAIANKLPDALQKMRFDTVISKQVIKHVYLPNQMINNVSEILKDGETVIITTPYHGYLKNLVMTICGKMDAHFTVLWEGGHIKFWPRKTLKQLLENHGFVVRHFRRGRIPYLWKSMLIEAEISKCVL